MDLDCDGCLRANEMLVRALCTACRVLGRLLQPRLGRAPVRELLRRGILIMVPAASNFTSVSACQFTYVSQSKSVQCK